MRILTSVRLAASLLLCLLAFPHAANAGCTPPSVTITGDAAFCSGSDTTLTANVSGGVAPYSYQWLRNNATLLGEEAATLLVTTPGSYSVVVTDAASCATQAPAVTVVENAPPVVEITGPEETCAGTPVTLDAGAGFVVYLWSTGDTTRSITVFPAATTDYEVTVTPNPTITIDAPPSVCSGSSGNIASVPFQAGATYDWVILNGTITGGQGTPAVTFDAGASGDVDIGVHIENGSCLTTGAATIPITEPFLDITGPSSACPNVPFILAATPGFVSYEWSTGQNGQFVNVIQIDEEVTYSVTAIDENGCSATAEFTVTLTGNPDATIDAPFSVLSRSNDNVASVPEQPGAVYTWQIANGTILSGAGTHSIVFEAGTAGEIELGVSVNVNGCVAGNSVIIAIDEPLPEGVDLSIGKSAPEIVRAGATFVYTIVVRNQGAEDAAGTFTDELPQGVQFVSVNAGSWNCFGTASVACSGVVEAGASSTIAITVRAPQQTGTITNRVTVTSPTADPDSGNNTASVDTIITAPPPVCATLPPSLIAPANDATVPSANPTFSWTAVSGADRYELWFVNDGAATFAAATPLTSIAHALPSGATRWFVVARLAEGCDALISSERTVIVPQSPGCDRPAAQLTAPPAGSQAATPVQFSWNAVPGAIGYRLSVSIDGGALQTISATSGATTLTAQLPAGRITAFVDTLLAGCPPLRSNGVTFTVTAPDACANRGFATLSAPDDNAVLDSSSVEFRWIPAPNADGSRVWVSIDGGEPHMLGTTTEGST
ncbi:MAG TPA: hypothetical protein VHL59_02570, partial [Thermoanaerobaculia bacterium]|nr:hypothetical protein [Thermoanaerobaculia bacterium]